MPQTTEQVKLKRIILLSFILSAIMSGWFGWLYGAIDIIPQPVLVQAGEGCFEVRPDTSIRVYGKCREHGQNIAEKIRVVGGYDLMVVDSDNSDRVENSICLILDNNLSDIGPEAYHLIVDGQGVVITASANAGLFYGLQTIYQLFPAEIGSKKLVPGIELAIPFVLIEDSPRFRWRGLHLDVGRHIFPVEFIKKYIDLMARYKLNTFHWHLTEDQGWRIEIKKYPLLTEIGSKRCETPMPMSPEKGDGKSYGGYYTQGQVQEIVAYAAARYITVVPEIEMPGHSVAALAAYPELGCSGGPYKVWTRWGVNSEVFCAGNDQTFVFIEEVLDEVLELFPSPVIHIGGDECPKESWKKCPKCQQRIKDNELADEHGLQSYFITRIEKYLNSKGRQIIGWDEILEGGLAPNAMVMSWRGIEGGIAAARQQHSVVMSPTSHCYFDYCQAKDRTGEPPTFGGFLPLEQVYSYEPVPNELTDEEAQWVIGVQGNLWTEYISTPAQAEYMAFPRAIALAEVAWSKPENKSLSRFRKSLQAELKRLDIIGVNYRRPDGN